MTALGPCEWPVTYAGCASCPPFTPPPEPTEQDLADIAALQATAEAMAIGYLWNWTGRTFGTCTSTIRPCRVECYEGNSTFWGRGPFPTGVGAGPWTPVLVGGEWFNIACGGCGRDDCSCTSIAVLRLPGPVISITEIVIDGVPLDESAYRVDDASLLVRLDGGQWPDCQDMEAPIEGEGSEGTWAITYVKGVEVPIGGQIAAGILSCEFAKAMCGDSSCQLPKRIQNITRQGVTVAMLDDFDTTKGMTGIWLIDSWVSSVTVSPRGGTVLSPDDFRPAVRHRRTTWPVSVPGPGP